MDPSRLNGKPEAVIPYLLVQWRATSHNMSLLQHQNRELWAVAQKANRRVVKQQQQLDLERVYIHDLRQRLGLKKGER